MTHPLFLPIFVMAVYFFVFVVLVGVQRVKAVKAKEINFKYFKTFSPEFYPKGDHTAIQYERHHANLYEAPTLFFIVILALIVLGNEGLWAQILAWGYVLTRFVHAYVHVGANNPLIRRKCFVVSWLFLLGLWGLALYSAL